MLIFLEPDQPAQAVAVPHLAVPVAPWTPLEVVDELAARWRQLSPLLKLSAVPLGLMFRPHRKFKWFRLFGTLFRLAPSVIRTFRAYRASTAEA